MIDWILMPVVAVLLFSLKWVWEFPVNVHILKVWYSDASGILMPGIRILTVFEWAWEYE